MSNLYYQCPHNPTCRNDQSIGKKPCRECVGMNRYQARRHTARQDLHRACDATCPVYNLDMESLKDYNFKPVASVNLQRKSIESPPSEDESAHPGRMSRRTRTSTQQEGTTDKQQITSIPAHRSRRTRTSTQQEDTTDKRQNTSIPAHRTTHRATTASPYRRAASTSPYLRNHNEKQPTVASPYVNDNTKVINNLSSGNHTNRNDERSKAVSSILNSKNSHQIGRIIKNCLRYLLLCLIATYLYSSWAPKADNCSLTTFKQQCLLVNYVSKIACLVIQTTLEGLFWLEVTPDICSMIFRGFLIYLYFRI
ncbi:hypothetical protein PGTUg99_008819 [Puccinia graminis f. sp. tritici]|uniref:Uncharacterized protein n=1 Tax=Puccinia graminis f. sp. tritici TaxID=56615 RepID=A0A5B0S0Y7_PUCGR|nr:hypothetical protein PGTUg99_008819 [Puccinia graminis f. sp. tritici]